MNRIYLHIVWTTKNRIKILTESRLPYLNNLLKLEYSRFSKVEVLAVNGYLDHIHVLLQYPPNCTSISQIQKTVKARTSYHINQHLYWTDLLYWQKGFACFSVSPHMVTTIRNYIQDQVEHHKSQAFFESPDFETNEQEIWKYYQKRG